MTKTIVITGATSGFGRACAEIFAAGGWRLVLCGRRRERLLELEEKLGKTAVHCASFDVRKLAEVEAMVAGLPDGFRSVDVLLNSAGLALGLNPAQTADLDDWERMVDTNIKGLFYMTRLLLPKMVERKQGHIINIGSVAGTWPYPGGNAYGATKAFVAQFSNNLRCDLHGSGVRVTNIEPGLAETEFSLVRFKGDKERAKKVYQGVKPLTGEDIGEIAFWVSNLPPHVNINTLEVMPTGQAWGPLEIYRES